MQFNFFNKLFPKTEEIPMIATIRQMKNGKFRLLINGNEVHNTYGRRRDAVRGANRAGFRLAA